MCDSESDCQDWTHHQPSSLVFDSVGTRGKYLREQWAVVSWHLTSHFPPRLECPTLTPPKQRVPTRSWCSHLVSRAFVFGHRQTPSSHLACLFASTVWPQTASLCPPLTHGCFLISLKLESRDRPHVLWGPWCHLFFTVSPALGTRLGTQWHSTRVFLSY